MFFLILCEEHCYLTLWHYNQKQNYSDFHENCSNIFTVDFEQVFVILPFDTWCSLKGHAYLNKPVAFNFMFV